MNGSFSGQLDSPLGHSLGHVSGSYDEGVFGGCDAKYGMGGFVAVLLLITAMMLLYYVAVFLKDMKKVQGRENVCGGKDQGCVCDGNEMLTGGKDNMKWVSRDVSEDSLSMVGSGL
jgi:hypothetical protein